MSMSCNNYSESQSCCTDDTLGVVITSDFDFSSGYSLMPGINQFLFHGAYLDNGFRASVPSQMCRL